MMAPIMAISGGTKEDNSKSRKKGGPKGPSDFKSSEELVDYDSFFTP